LLTGILFASAMQAQVQLRCSHNQAAQDLATAVVTEKGASQMLSCVLTIMSMEAQSIQWLSSQLETERWQENPPVTQLQDCSKYEQAAAERIHFYGMFSQHSFGEIMNPFGLLRSCVLSHL
jgi:hypothetical protein